MPRSRLNRIGKPLREANILRVVVSPESLVMNVPARHDVVLGRRDRKELTEGFSVLLDEAFRFPAIRGRVQLSVYPSFCLKGLMHDE